MVLAIETFEDLLNIIHTHPEWRHKLVRALFPEIDLPKAIQELAESNRLMRIQLGEIGERLERMEERQGRTEERQGRTEERQERTEERQERMEERQGRTEERQGRMEERQDRMEVRLDQIDGRLDRVEVKVTTLDRSVADLKGMNYEDRLRFRADAIFGLVLRRGREAKNELTDQLEAAEDAGDVSELEYAQVVAADLLWTGRLKQNREPVNLVVEASWRAEEHDLDRAATRAKIVARLGVPAIPVVAAIEWPEEIRRQAIARGIVIVDNLNLDRASWGRAETEG